MKISLKEQEKINAAKGAIFLSMFIDDDDDESISEFSCSPAKTASGLTADIHEKKENGFCTNMIYVSKEDVITKES